MTVHEYKLEDFEHVVLETKPEPEGQNFEWLMRDCMSTTYADVIREGE